MAKDLVNSAADGLLKETLAILKGRGTDADKVANALDHLSLGLQARKLAAKRMAAKPAKVEANTGLLAGVKSTTPATSSLQKPEAKVEPVVAAQANGSAEKPKAGMFGR